MKVLVEAGISLVLGIGSGFGFLYGTGALKSSGEIAALTEKYATEAKNRSEKVLDAERSSAMEQAEKALSLAMDSLAAANKNLAEVKAAPKPVQELVVAAETDVKDAEDVKTQAQAAKEEIATAKSVETIRKAKTAVGAVASKVASVATKIVATRQKVTAAAEATPGIAIVEPSQQPAQPKPAAVGAAAFGTLMIKALGTELDVSGEGISGHGSSVSVPFKTQPGKVKVKAGKYTLSLSPKPFGGVLGLDISVSPLAIIQVGGNAVGTSASGLEIGKGGTSIELKSPANGEVSLVLSYKK